MGVIISCDLRPRFGAARNQGSRPTCCAFATSDLHAACRSSSWNELSPEFAFFHGARRQGTGPHRGVYLHHMIDAIEQDGQPTEVACPYMSVVPAGWSPPPTVGKLYKANGLRTVGALSDIRAKLDSACPVLVVASISDAFYQVDGDGVVDSNEAVDLTRVHAMVAVGHGSRGSTDLILVRNSWGQLWGDLGHAWVSDTYLRPRMIEYATMTEVP